METVFITRTKNEKDLKEPDFIKFIETISSSGIKKIYIISNFEDTVYKINKIKVEVLKDPSPTGPISINTAIRKISKEDTQPDAFLVASKEVGLSKKRIAQLIKQIKREKGKLLVAGYKLRIKKDERLENELKQYYLDKNLIAYKVPWNTCAIWNYKLFVKHVGKFDEVTARSPFDDVCVCIDGQCSKTKHQGMEDGLAIAKARSNDSSIEYVLMEPLLNWAITNEQRQSHREKLARKEVVMRDLMALRNYSVEDLIIPA